MADYRTEHARSIQDPEGYWGEQALLVDWIKKPTRVLDDDHPPFYRWYPDATLNTCFNALDRHVAHGHGDRTALIYDSAVADTQESYTFARLLERTAAFAGALRGFGVAGRRPGGDLHADGPGGGHRDAGHCPARGGALGRLRRLRGP